jgi:hypothetical protein
LILSAVAEDDFEAIMPRLRENAALDWIWNNVVLNSSRKEDSDIPWYVAIKVRAGIPLLRAAVVYMEEWRRYEVQGGGAMTGL